jgi:hypothetical protein
LIEKAKLANQKLKSRKNLATGDDEAVTDAPPARTKLSIDQKLSRFLAIQVRKVS